MAQLHAGSRAPVPETSSLLEHQLTPSGTAPRLPRGLTGLYQGVGRQSHLQTQPRDRDMDAEPG